MGVSEQFHQFSGLGAAFSGVSSSVVIVGVISVNPLTISITGQIFPSDDLALRP